MAAVQEEAEVSEQEPPAQVDPSGRWTRTNDILGKGAFKTVYKGFDGLEGLEVAWNQIRMNELVSTKEDRDRLFAEIRVLKQLKHKNIMTFHDSWLEKQGYTVNFITELFTSGTLRQYRKRHRFLDSEVMKRWAWQILCGLVYLHGHTPPIIHRDLKCDNIFINGSEGVVKIGDLGLATMLRARTAPQSVLGTPEFMAPELYDEEYDDRVDVYSFGMCLLELATLEYPYSECRNAAQIYRKVTLGVRPKALGRVTNKQLADFVCHCIQPRESRPRSRQLLKHHYFDSIRAEKLTLKLGVEALRLPLSKDSESHPELHEYATSGGSTSGSISRASSAADETHQDPTYLLDAVPEEDDEASVTSKGNSECHEEQAVCSERDFKVRGKLQEEEDKLSLRLRILQAERAPKVVEFDFDLNSDTAISVASEMVEEMSLSHTDAARIAQAIKEEIFNLTRKSLEGHHRAAASLGSASDDEVARKSMDGPTAVGNPNPFNGGVVDESMKGVPPRPASDGGIQTASEGGFQEGSMTEVDFEVQPRSKMTSACSDSVMSVHDAQEDPFYTNQQAAPSGSPDLCASMPADSLGYVTPPSSIFSLGSSPQQDALLAEAPPPQEQPPAPSVGGYPTSSKSSNALPTGLPPPPSLSRTRSEGLFRRLGRTDSANHAHEMEALQQALGHKASANGTGKLLSPLPKEEDRRLPLKKWMESMKELVQDPKKQQAPPRIETAPGKLDPSPTPDREQQSTALRSSSSPSTNAEAKAALQQPPELRKSPLDLRRVSADSALTSGAVTTSGRTCEAANGNSAFCSHGSPRREGNLAAAPGPAESHSSTGGSPGRRGNRSEHGPEISQAKEAKRQAMAEAAQNSLRNMESRSLEGLGDFGMNVSRAHKQVPLRNLLGGGKP